MVASVKEAIQSQSTSYTYLSGEIDLTNFLLSIGGLMLHLSNLAFSRTLEEQTINRLQPCLKTAHFLWLMVFEESSLSVQATLHAHSLDL